MYFLEVLGEYTEELHKRRNSQVPAVPGMYLSFQCFGQFPPIFTSLVVVLSGLFM